MSLFLILSFLFFIGAISGWVIELLFRRFFSRANPERKWINPGFCTGPYVPLYGFGLCILFLIASLETNGITEGIKYEKALLFISMAVMMTVIEYIAGILLLKVAHIRLWDYSREWGNIQGLICPKFSLIWAILGAAYYFLIHPRILNALHWFTQNLAFSFVVGLFFGVFIIDVAHSMQLTTKLRQIAKENDANIKLEHLKLELRQAREESKMKYHFFLPFKSTRPISEHFDDMRDSFEARKHRTKKGA